MDEIVLQPFVPADYHIADMEMAVRVDGVHEQDRVFVTIYNDAFDMIWQEVVYFSAIEAMGRNRSIMSALTLILTAKEF